MSEFHSTDIFTFNVFRHILPTCEKYMDVCVCLYIYIYNQSFPNKNNFSSNCLKFFATFVKSVADFTSSKQH